MDARSRRLLALIGFSLAHCSADDRQLVVVVSTDLPVPGELASVDVRIEDDAGALLASQGFVIAGPQGVGVPFSFGVAPREAGPMVLVVQARGPNLPDTFPAVRRRIESLPSGRSGLAIYLSRACQTEVCPGGTVCLDGLCGPSLVAAGELVPLGAEQNELDLACSTGPMRCSVDETRRRSCGVLGQPPTETACPTDQRCDASEARCVPDDDDTLRVEVSVNDGSLGRVVSNPAGIRCGLDQNACSGRFPRDSTITLTAEASASGQFLEWTGDCSGNGDCVLELSTDRNVGATFSAKPPDGIEVQIALLGNGSGEVRFSLPPDQPPCSSDCSRTFPRGTLVRLEAEPEVQTEFVGWGAGCSGTASCLPNTTNETSVAVTAQFDRSEWNVRVEFIGGGDAQLLSNSVGICSTPQSPCAVTFPASGDEVSLEVIPSLGARVIGFSGVCQSAGSSCRFVPSSDGILQIDVQPPSRFDLNGDGMDELLVGAPGAGPDENAEAPGRLYVVAGPPGGNGLVAAETLFSFQGEVGDEAGRVFAFPGDLDGDGISDLVVGSPTADGQHGVVYVIPGHTDLGTRTSLRGLAIAELRGQAASRFGSSVLALPDQNGDGRPEFAVGIPGQRRVEVYSYSAAQRSFVVISTLEGAGVDLGFGSSMVNLGNIDGSPGVELAIAAPNATVGGVLFAGAVHIFRGPFNVPNLTASGSWRRILGATLNQGVGAALAAGQDFTMPGSRDLAVTASLGNNGRMVAVFSDLANRATRDVPYAEDQSTLVPPVGSSVSFGSSLLFAGDLLNAGGGTLLIGDPELGGSGLGTVLVYPREGATIPPRILGGGDCSMEGCTNNLFGASLGPVPDFDGDGFSEFAVGARWGGGTAGSVDRGRVFFFASSDLRTSRFLPRFVVQGENIASGLCLSLGPPY